MYKIYILLWNTMVVGWGTEQHSIAYLRAMSSTITNIRSASIIKIYNNIKPTSEIRAFYLYYDNIIMFGFDVVVGSYDIIDYK